MHFSFVQQMFLHAKFYQNPFSGSGGVGQQNCSRTDIFRPPNLALSE